jgi:hypothetical protein
MWQQIGTDGILNSDDININDININWYKFQLKSWYWKKENDKTKRQACHHLSYSYRPFFLSFVFQMDVANIFGLALNLQSSCHCLLSSWIYRYQPLCRVTWWIILDIGPASRLWLRHKDTWVPRWLINHHSLTSSHLISSWFWAEGRLYPSIE